MNIPNIRSFCGTVEVLGVLIYIVCKQYMDSIHPDIIVLMELRVDDERLMRTCHLLGFDEFHYLKGIGFFGGIFEAWRTSCVNIDILITRFQFIHMKIMTQRRDD